MSLIVVECHSVNAPTIPQFETRHRLKLALEASGHDVADMATELGVTPQTVHNYLRGDRTPIRAVIKQWAQVCQVPWQWIVTGDLPDPTDPQEGDVSKTNTGREWADNSLDNSLFQVAA